MVVTMETENVDKTAQEKATEIRNIVQGVAAKLAARLEAETNKEEINWEEVDYLITSLKALASI